MNLLLFLGGNVLNKKRIGILLGFIILIGMIVYLVFFSNKTTKNLKIGNNTSSQEIVNYILNISSYETMIEVKIESNKNQNCYKIKQQYKKDSGSEQEILEPSNIAGIKISKSGNQLKLENTNLKLSSIFENYEYVSDNILDLSCFIEDYKADEKANWEEEENQIVMTTKNKQEEKKLWVDRNTGKPIRLESKCENKKGSVYILYNEININCFE